MQSGRVYGQIESLPTNDFSPRAFEFERYVGRFSLFDHALSDAAKFALSLIPSRVD